MAIAFDAAAGQTLGIATSSVSHSHTCTGSDRILFAMGKSGLNADMTATYNGVSMTSIARRWNAATATSTQLFYLLAPASGANTLTMNFGGSSTGYLGSASYTGVGSGQPDASNSGDDNTSPYQLSVTTVADNCWVIAAFGGDGLIAAGTGTTARSGDGSQSALLADNNAAKTPAGSVTLEATSGSSGGCGIVIASFSPGTQGGGAAPTPIQNLLLMGAG